MLPAIIVVSSSTNMRSSQKAIVNDERFFNPLLFQSECRLNKNTRLLHYYGSTLPNELYMAPVKLEFSNIKFFGKQKIAILFK